MALAGVAMTLIRKDDEAVAWLRRAVETNRNYAPAHFWLAAALAHLGRLNEARVAVQAGRAIDPNFTMSRARSDISASNNSTFLAQRDRVLE